jgi:carboxymethylenebutenolidase
MRLCWLALHCVLLVSAFVAAQQPPRTLGTKITLENGTAKFRAVQVQQPGKGPYPAVVMLHGDFGLTEWTRKQADRLAEKGYLVLALDLYDGELPKSVEEAHILERGLEERRVLAGIKAAVDHLESLSTARKGPIGIIGWDCGGGYALDAAIADRRLKAAVMCYGRVTTDAKRLASLEGNVLALFGGKDEGIPPATIEQFKKAMARAGKPATIHVYSECGNSFMDPDSPYFEGKADHAAIADAWAKIEAHLDRALRK